MASTVPLIYSNNSVTHNQDPPGRSTHVREHIVEKRTEQNSSVKADTDFVNVVTSSSCRTYKYYVKYDENITTQTFAIYCVLQI